VQGLRVAAGLSVNQLARQCGVAKGTILALEAGDGNPTVATLFAVADAFGCTVRDLLSGITDPMLKLVRSTDRREVDGQRVDALLLHRFVATGPVEIYEITIGPEERRRSAAHAEGCYEHVWVHHGSAHVGWLEAPAALGVGDYLCFDGARPHVYDAGPDGCVLLIVLTSARDSV
jgi:transcriptional regulator with XRE-family HTH domain